MSDLEIRGLQLAYGKSQALAVADLDLSVAQGELVSLLGPSGCGKTTTMRAVAGLITPRAGTIVLGGQDITHLPAHQRDLGMVFQSYALFPHLSAFENVAFGLRLRKVGETALRERVDQALESVGLQGFAERLPANLSGGSSNALPWPGPWFYAHACCCWMSPCQTSMPSCVSTCVLSCDGCSAYRASPCCM